MAAERGGGARWSLRRQLLAGFLALLGAVLLLSALFQYFALRGFLIATAVSRLQSAVHAAAASGPAPPSGLVRALAGPRTTVWVLGPDGAVLAASPGAGRAGLDPRTVGSPWTIVGDTLAVRLPLGGGGALGRRPPGPGPGMPSATVVMATSLADVNGILGSEVRLLALGGLAALVAAAIAAAWTLARGLRPLAEIAAVADAVSAGSLDRRARAGGLPAELATVAVALNGMLDRLGGALRQERAAQERLRRFLADASHELRTPLTAVMGYLELWREGAGRGEAEMEAGLAVAHGQARRMASLVEGLLALARVEEGGAQAVSFDLRRLLAGLRDEAPNPAVRWPEGGSPLTVRGSADAIARAVRNLVGNAVKFGPPDGPVDVGIASVDGWALVEVADRGPGIAPEDLPHVFDRFYRGPSDRPGSGLGLAIVAAVAQAHGGAAELVPRPGGGIIARLRLPLAQGPGPARDTSAGPSPAGA